MIKPLRDQVLVKKEEAAERSPGGLFIPTTVDQMIWTGKISFAGHGRVTSEGKLIPLEVKVGDKVVFDKRHAQELKYEGETYFLLREDSLLAVIV